MLMDTNSDQPILEQQLNALRCAGGPRCLFFPHSPFFSEGLGPVMDVSFVEGGIMAGLPPHNGCLSGGNSGKNYSLLY